MIDFPESDPFSRLIRAAEEVRQAADPVEAMLRLMKAEADYRASTQDPDAPLIEQWALRWKTFFAQLAKMQVPYAMAARISPFEEGTIRNKVSKGELKNEGTRSEPTVRLGSLPICPEKAPLAQPVLGNARLQEEMKRDQVDAKREGGKRTAIQDRVQRAQERLRRAG